LSRISRHRALRFIAWAAAYVLALQTMLLGLGAVPSLASASTGSLAVQLCLTGGEGAGAGEPSRHLTVQHCLGCFAGFAAVPGPAPTLVPVAYTASALAATVIAQVPNALASAGRPGLPRAPPVLA
jgi:hypothetical protein